MSQSKCTWTATCTYNTQFVNHVWILNYSKVTVTTVVTKLLRTVPRSLFSKSLILLTSLVLTVCRQDQFVSRVGPEAEYPAEC